MKELKILYQRSNYWIIVLFEGLLLLSVLLFPKLQSEVIFLIFPIVLPFLSCKDRIDASGITQIKFFFIKKVYPYNQIKKVVCNGCENYSSGGNDSNCIMFINQMDRKIVFRTVFKNRPDEFRKIKRILRFIEKESVSVYLYVPESKKRVQLFSGFPITDNLCGYNWLW